MHHELKRPLTHALCSLTKYQILIYPHPVAECFNLLYAITDVKISNLNIKTFKRGFEPKAKDYI